MIKNELLRKSLRIIAIAFLVCALYLFGQDVLGRYNHQRENDQLDQILTDITETIIDNTNTDPTEVKPETVKGSVEFYDKLKSINDDYVGWITVPALHVDFPMVIGNNNSYYLGHSLYKKSSKYGTIMVDYRNKKLYDEVHLVIYGHHMKDKTMFSYLDTLRKQSNYEANKYINLYTPDGLKRYLIFSVFAVDSTTTSMALPYTGDPQNLISSYEKKALYKTGVDTSKATQILTLVTCTLAVTNGRLFINAIPVED